MISIDEFGFLKTAVESGIISVSESYEFMRMAKRKKYLAMHNYKIYQGKDGYYNTYLPDTSKPTGRRLVHRKTMKSLEDALIEYYGSGDGALTLSKVFYEWLNSRIDYGEICRRSYNLYENDFKYFFSTIEDKKIEDISYVYLEDFIKKSIRDKHMTRKVFSRMKTLINGFMKYANRKGYTKFSVNEFFETVELSRRSFTRKLVTDEENVFTDEELSLLEYYIDNNADALNLAIKLVIYTGLRVGEVSALKYEDLDSNVLTVRRTEISYKSDDGNTVREVRDYTKGKYGIRKVIVTDVAVETIQRMKELDPNAEYLVSSDGKRVYSAVIGHRLKRMCSKVGIPPRSIHKLRKTYATKLLNAGVSERLIIEQMGHTSIETTKNHYFYNNYGKEKSALIIGNALAR